MIRPLVGARPGFYEAARFGLWNPIETRKALFFCVLNRGFADARRGQSIRAPLVGLETPGPIC